MLGSGAVAASYGPMQGGWHTSLWLAVLASLGATAWLLRSRWNTYVRQLDEHPDPSHQCRAGRRRRRAALAKAAGSSLGEDPAGVSSSRVYGDLSNHLAEATLQAQRSQPNRGVHPLARGCYSRAVRGSAVPRC